MVRAMAMDTSSTTKATPNNNLRDRTIDKTIAKRRILSSPMDMAGRTKATPTTTKKTMAPTIDSTIHGISKRDIILRMVRECNDHHHQEEIRTIKDARLSLQDKILGMVSLGIAPTTQLSLKIDASWKSEMAMVTGGMLENQW
jgi:hypothetical protein